MEQDVITHTPYGQYRGTSAAAADRTSRTPCPTMLGYLLWVVLCSLSAVVVLSSPEASALLAAANIPPTRYYSSVKRINRQFATSRTGILDRHPSPPGFVYNTTCNVCIRISGARSPTFEKPCCYQLAAAACLPKHTKS